MKSKIVLCILLCIPVLTSCTSNQDSNRHYGEGREAWRPPLLPPPPPSPYDKREPLITPYPGPLCGSIDYPKESNYSHKHHKKHHRSHKRIGVLPPKYLQVKDFKECLGTEQVNTYTQYCVPEHKPEHCSFESWQQLVKLDISRCKF